LMIANASWFGDFVQFKHIGHIVTHRIHIDKNLKFKELVK